MRFHLVIQDDGVQRLDYDNFHTAFRVFLNLANREYIPRSEDADIHLVDDESNICLFGACLSPDHPYRVTSLEPNGAIFIYSAADMQEVVSI